MLSLQRYYEKTNLYPEYRRRPETFKNITLAWATLVYLLAAILETAEQGLGSTGHGAKDF